MSTLTATRHWVVTDDGREVSGPHACEHDAEVDRHDRQPGHDRPLFVVGDQDD